jgi:hypothetical protein
LADPRGLTDFLVIELKDPDPQWVPGAFSRALSTRVRSQTGTHEVFVRIAPPDTLGPVHTFEGARARVAELFGTDIGSIEQLSLGELRSAVAELLGHLEREVDFVYP